MAKRLERNKIKQIVAQFTALRLRLGWSGRKAAQRLEISPWYFQLIEKYLRVPTPEVLQRMCLWLVYFVYI